MNCSLPVVCHVIRGIFDNSIFILVLKQVLIWTCYLSFRIVLLVNCIVQEMDYDRNG